VATYDAVLGASRVPIVPAPSDGSDVIDSVGRSKGGSVKAIGDSGKCR
jgi:hypothetical protein